MKRKFRIHFLRRKYIIYGTFPMNQPVSQMIHEELQTAINLHIRLNTKPEMVEALKLELAFRQSILSKYLKYADQYGFDPILYTPTKHITPDDIEDMLVVIEDIRYQRMNNYKLSMYSMTTATND